MFGPKKQDFWSKINSKQMKLTNLVFLSFDRKKKIGRHFSNKAVLKLKLEKMFFFYKKWFLELIFLNDLFWKKNPLIFDIGN